MVGKQSRAVVLSVAIALLLGLGGWWAAAGGRASTESAPPSSPASAPAATAGETAAAPPAKGADRERAWTPGTLYRYELTADQQVSFRQGQPGTPVPPGMRFLIQGEWDVGIISARDGRIDAQVHLRPSSFSMSVDGQDALHPDVRRTMTAGLGRPFFISLERSGAVRFVHFEKDTDMLVQGLLRSLVVATQFVVSGKPGAAWEAQEVDSTGQYSASYTRLAAERFEKSKRAYSHLASSEGLVAIDSSMRVDVRSRATFELAQDDLWTRSLQAQETLELDVGSGTPPASSSLQLALRLLERRQEASLLGALAARQASLISLPLGSFLGQTQDPLNHHRQVLGDKRFEDMVSDLRSLPKEQKARDDARTVALERLRALFMLQPAEALRVHDILRSGLEPVAASPMLGALSAASTPEAIQALSKAVDDTSLSPLVRMDAIAALGAAGEPNREGVDALRRLTRDADPMLRETATLALGNAALQMQDDNARGSESLLLELMNAYRSATSPEQQALILSALGNTRSPSVLPILQEGLRSQAPAVRGAAVVALRNIPDPSVDRLMAERLVGDPAPEVRKSVVFSCSFRPLTPVLPAIQQALRVDPAAVVRSEIVHLLGAQRATLPQADSLLAWASENDSSPDIRAAARSYLSPSARPLPTP